MFYPEFKLDWIPRKRTQVARARVFPLTLGHIRTLELLENACVSSTRALDAVELGQLLAVARLDWRTARKRAARASLLFRAQSQHFKPRNDEEARAIIEWLDAQFFRPTRNHIDPSEAKLTAVNNALARDTASVPSMRIAQALAEIPRALDLLRVRSIWDAPLIGATHLLIARAENNGIHHFNADTIYGA